MAKPQNVEVKIVRDSVFIGSKHIRPGVHSVSSKIAESWLKRGIAVEPGDDPEEKAKVSQAKELEETKAELKKVKTELTKANKDLEAAKAELEELKKPKE